MIINSNKLRRFQSHMAKMSSILKHFTVLRMISQIWANLILQNSHRMTILGPSEFPRREYKITHKSG